MHDTRLGIILLECPFIRTEEVERCLQIQSLGAWRKPIGQVLLEEGVISAQMLDLVLKIQDRRRTRARVRDDDAEPRFNDEVMPDLAELLDRARALRATDVILSLQRRPRARSGGRLVALSSMRVERCWMKAALRGVLDTSLPSDARLGTAMSVRLEAHSGQSCYVQVFCDRHGPCATIRMVPELVPDLQQLGHCDSVGAMLEELSGLVIVGGGPRSGKSTTIASMVQHIATKRAVHVLVLDEFHEFSYAGDSLVTRKRVPHDGAAQAAALRSSFREDPDVIVVGNLVGAESLELCMQLASTGHLVIVGMQSPSCVSALERLERGIPEGVIDQFRGNLASTLRGIVHQELVTGADDASLVLATEAVRPSIAFRRAIAEGRYDRIPILLSFEAGESRSMDDVLMTLVEEGRIRIEDAFARAKDRHRFLVTAG